MTEENYLIALFLSLKLEQFFLVTNASPKSSINQIKKYTTHRIFFSDIKAPVTLVEYLTIFTRYV